MIGLLQKESLTAGQKIQGADHRPSNINENQTFGLLEIKQEVVKFPSI